MAANGWNWKGKDGSRGGLLYEPGNWGDLLKMLWLATVLEWKAAGVLPGAGKVDFFDPFAGDVTYPLGSRTLFRFARADLKGLAFIRQPFLARGVWPSSASMAGLLAAGGLHVFDADAERRGNWRSLSAATVMEGESGWDLLSGRETGVGALWLVDPYDFLAEWRERLGMVVDKSAESSVLLYVYNRSARSDKAFGEYRAFRRALEDRLGGRPMRLGRVAADAFLPRSHHEVVFLPCAGDADDRRFGRLLSGLEEGAAELASALDRVGACDA